jgi:hypothetical protein
LQDTQYLFLPEFSVPQLEQISSPLEVQSVETMVELQAAQVNGWFGLIAPSTGAPQDGQLRVVNFMVLQL